MSWLDNQLQKLAEKVGQILVDKLPGIAETIGRIVAEQVMALLPVIVASAVNAARNQATATVDQLTQTVRQDIQARTGIKLPTLSEVMQGFRPR